MTSSQLIHLALFGLVLVALARRLPRLALARPVALAMIFGAIFIFGAAALIQLPVELMPNASSGNVTVFIDVRGGMPPPEVERLVTKPVEEAMSTVSGLRNLVSSSKKDRSVVTLEFDPGSNMDLATMEVREKFLRVKAKLPPEIEKPIVARYEESDTPILITALISDSKTPEDIRRLVEGGLKDKLMRVSGVANVDVGGGRERKIVVDVDRFRLAAAGLTIHRVVGILEQNNLNIRTGDVSGAAEPLVFGVRTVGAYRRLDDIANLTLSVASNNGRVRLKDIADVKDSYLEDESFTRLNARSAVTLYIQKESSANTVRVAGDAQKVLDDFEKTLPADVQIVTISNQRSAIVSAIDSVKMTLLYGVALVVLVLPLFLAKTKGTRAISAFLLGLLVLNVLVFYILRWNLNNTVWPVGLILAGITILAFLRADLRTSFVVALSIPMSCAMTLVFMYAEGVTINVMSLSGLILGIGLLVDNAVVVVENYDRLVAENPRRPLAESMLLAADEMVPSIVGGTLTVVVVFLPFSLLQKQTQILFGGISFAVTASLLSSFFVALTLVPALAARLDPEALTPEALPFLSPQWQRRGAENMARLSKEFSAILRNLKSIPSKVWIWAGLAFSVVYAIFSRGPWWGGIYVAGVAFLVAGGIYGVRHYAALLQWCLGHRAEVFAGVAVTFVLAVGLFIWGLPKDFMAASEQNEFIIFVELDTGLRLDISNRVVEEVEKAVRDFGPTKLSIKNVSSKVEGWSSKIFVTLKDTAERAQSTQEVINALRPEVDKVLQPYSDKYKAFNYFSEPRAGKEVVVEIFGYEYDLMAKQAMDVAARLGKNSALSDVKIRYRPGRPQITVKIDPEKAAAFGLSVQAAAESLHAQMRGLRATTFFDQSQEIETVVRVRPDQHETVTQLKSLLVPTMSGGEVAVSQVAKVEGDLSPSEIWHRNKARMIQVSANLSSTSLESAAHYIKGVLRKISFPSGYYADIGGQYEDMRRAQSDFWKALLLTVFLVFMVMACQFESMSHPLVIMGTVVLSAMGATAALVLFNTTVTLGVTVGLLMLGGIVVNHGIMLIDRVRIVKAQRPDLSAEELVLEAGQKRVRPIFMTTVTTVLGLVPMALDRSDSAVLWSPLAITVIGGLVSSTVLTLYVVPCLYCALDAFEWKNIFSLKNAFLKIINHSN